MAYTARRWLRSLRLPSWCVPHDRTRARAIASASWQLSILTCVPPQQRLEEEFQKFRDMVELAIDLEAAENHEYLIRPQFDDSLQALNDEKTHVTQSISQHFTQVNSKLGLKTLQISYFPQFSWCFRVSRKVLTAVLVLDTLARLRHPERRLCYVCVTRHQEEKDLRQVRTIKYQTVDTKKDGVKFRTPELKVLGDKYDQLHKEYLERQVDLSKDLIAVACTSS